MDQPGDRHSGEAVVARLNAFGALDSAELAGLSDAAGPERSFSRDEILWREGDRLPGLFLLVEGWMASRRTCENTASHLLKLHLPGDLLGLPSLAFKAAGESTIALTAAKVRPLRLHSFGALFDAHPRIAAMVFMVSLQERMDLTDRLMAVYRSDPAERVAATVLLLWRRIARSFPDVGNTFRLPLTSSELADLVGVSKSRLMLGLKALHEANLVGWSRQRLTILDPEGLAAVAKLPDRTLVEDPHWMPPAS